MASPASTNNALALAGKLFFQILLLTLFASFQTDNSFKTFSKTFPLEKSHEKEIGLSLEKAEPLQIQIVYKVENKEPVNTNLSLTVNNQKAGELQIKGTGSKRTKFVAPQTVFKKGTNPVAWKLKNPGVILEEIKFVNYVGINPNIPVAWVVPDEHVSSPSNPVYFFARIFFLISLTVSAYAGISRLLFCNFQLSACFKYLFIPLAIFCATLLYGASTPFKIIFPEETIFWLVGFGLLSAQLHSIFFSGEIAKANEARKNNIIVYLICLISILAYLGYFKNSWYIQDDYGTIDVGGRGSFWTSAKRITTWLHENQGRYQPVRLLVFMFFNHLAQEEYSAYYNFALHLANLTLLYFLLRKFKAEPIIILPTVLLFSLFGKWRMMESTSVMVGGSGLNFFFIAFSLLYLIKALETTRSNTRKMIFLGLSSVSYACLVFSYEIAFPLILPLIYTFIAFSPKTEGSRMNEKDCQRKTGPRASLETYHTKPDGSFWKRSNTYFNLSPWPLRFNLKNRLSSELFRLKNYSLLAPFFLLLAVYLVFFKLNAKGSYVGTTLSWNFPDIWTRLVSYLNYTFSFRINLAHVGGVEIAIFLLYLSGAIIAQRSEQSATTVFRQKRTDTKILWFGLIFYISSLVLFTLNSWESPTDIMFHHTYLMTVGSSILLVFSIFHAQWYLPGITFKTTSNLQRVFRSIFITKYYRFSLIFIIFPLVLISEASYTRRIYDKPSLGLTAIKPIKEVIQNLVDPTMTNAIIIKNFYHNYYWMSSVSGAFIQWFDFINNIDSGRVILSARDDKILFMGSLSYYKPDSKQEKREVANNRAQIFFLDNKTLLPYQDFIDFEEGKNLHQTQHVWGDKEPVEFLHYRLDAILKNSSPDHFIKIKTKSPKDLEWLIENMTRIEINNKTIQQSLVSGDSLYIDVGASKNSLNYFFLTVVSTDKKFKEILQMICLQNPEEEAIPRTLENIPPGVDAWGIG